MYVLRNATTLHGCCNGDFSLAFYRRVGRKNSELPSHVLFAGYCDDAQMLTKLDSFVPLAVTHRYWLASVQSRDPMDRTCSRAQMPRLHDFEPPR